MSWLLRKKKNRVLVLGWDCAGAWLVFDSFKGGLPVLESLMRQGVWGELESSIPCITVPAWASMLSGRDPGVLGIYGFRNRTDYSYAQMATANSASVRVQRVWDYLSAANRRSILVGVPQTYPVQPLNGSIVSCFLTPGVDSAFTFPALLKQDVLRFTPDYRFDVKDFRTLEKDRLLQQIIDLTEVQFKLVKRLMTSQTWEFLMHVNIGVDRIHHGFWRYHDPQHRLHEAGSRFATAIFDYYKMIDRMAGELIELAGDDVHVLVVSDHGVKRMDGGFCINEWLIRAGWLSLKTPPIEGRVVPFEQAEVDWSRTKAWASGGYYGRIFLNVANREAHGIVPPSQYEAIRDELARLLAAFPGPDGTPLINQVYKPQEIYAEVNGIAPDLLVYFGDLHWRALGSLGHDGLFTFENDTGPDDANHAPEGMFVLYEPGRGGAGQINGHQLMDIAPTLLDRTRVPVPPQLQGKIIRPR